MLLWIFQSWHKSCFTLKLQAVLNGPSCSPSREQVQSTRAWIFLLPQWCSRTPTDSTSCSSVWGGEKKKFHDQNIKNDDHIRLTSCCRWCNDPKMTFRSVQSGTVHILGCCCVISCCHYLCTEYLNVVVFTLFIHVCPRSDRVQWSYNGFLLRGERPIFAVQQERTTKLPHDGPLQEPSSVWPISGFLGEKSSYNYTLFVDRDIIMIIFTHMSHVLLQFCCCWVMLVSFKDFS